ncbi:DUF1799 domain-containing protein [Vreelandella venusta]|uniref:DUF1799 domain-containing protein n=1 Tax=Vreelandella venusta TaxID=44935 RepID=UPI00200BC63D|nr:DUF1799 domain-containing protein [Halomonas venusta]UQI42524.1 DUF1799 domain-containing protein [Halomonas venusta]
MVRCARRSNAGRRKKLTGAGRCWAGDRVEDARAADAAVLGIAAPVDDTPTTYAIWCEHWPALELFLALRTQWRIIAGMAGAQHQGLDYTALYGHPKYARLGYDEQEKLLAQIQHIEAGAVSALNEQNNHANQEDEERKQVTQYIEQCTEQAYQLEHQQRERACYRELVTVMDVPSGYGDGAFVA